MDNENKQKFDYQEFGDLIDDIQKDAPQLESNEKASLESFQKSPAKKSKKVKRARSHRISWYSYLLIVADVLAIICFYLFYGPISTVREWYITTAITTGRHKWFAYMLYDQKAITTALANNSFIGVEGETDASKIQFVENPDTGYYKNEYDKQIVKKDYEGQQYKIINFNEDGTRGYIAVIYNPARLNLVMSSTSYGSTMTTYAKPEGVKVAINAGGHYLHSDNTISPMGGLIINGKVKNNSKKNDNLICMTNDNVLFLHYGTASEALKKGARWAVTFGPFLIVNGNSAKFKGNGGYGTRPRTAIGQREDGIVLLVVIDGRSGATMPQLIRIFERYSCVNAANLDGGGSSMMVVEKQIINHPAGLGYSGERYVINAVVYEP